MAEKVLVYQTPTGFDPASQAMVARLAWMIEDQWRIMLASVEGASPELLQWQAAPGRNTIGMLLLHCITAELWWMAIRMEGVANEAAEARFTELAGFGMDDDGLPLGEDSLAPANLDGKDLAFFVEKIERCRALTVQMLRGVRDENLGERIQYRGGSGIDVVVSKEWILYHVLEHLAQHAGQVALLRRLAEKNGVKGAAPRA